MPIYFHGGTRFVLGDLGAIQSSFEPFSDEVNVEAWRHPPEPLAPFRYQRRLYWHKPSLWNKSSYVLDIRARRRTVVPYFDNPPIGTREKLWNGLRYR